MPRHLSVHSSAHLSVWPSLRLSIGSPYNHFAWRIKKKIACDLCRAYGVVINLEIVGQECLSANLYVCQSISVPKNYGLGPVSSIMLK